MRWMLVAAVVAFSSVGVHASETIVDEAPSVVDVSEVAAGVTVSAIPAPAPVVEVLKLEDPVARLRSGKKLRLAKKAPPPTMMLSLTQRRQVALLVAHDNPSGDRGLSYNQGDDSQGGLDELDLHRSYSRPRVVTETPDDKTDEPALSSHVRLRLLLARLKAVEAHVLNQVPDSDEALPESVLLRLRDARMLAVQAHRTKFS